MKKHIKQSGRDEYVGLKIAAAFFGGVALGMLCAPFIKGIGNNSGNITYHYHWTADNMPDEPDVELPEGVKEVEAE